MSDSLVPRRSFLVSGVAVAAGTGFLGASPAGAAPAAVRGPGGDGTMAGLDATSTAAFTVPAPVPGAQSKTYGFGSFEGWAFGSEANAIHVGSGVYYSDSGNIVANLDLPAGSVVHRVDCFASTNQSTNWELTRSGVQLTTGIASAIGVAANAELTVSLTPGTPYTTQPGDALSVLALGLDDGNNTIRAVTVHYTPPGQELVLSPSIVRVYDSRAGQAPLGVAKGTIGNGGERVVDATLDGALPAGARSALVNLTVAQTSAIGFLGLYDPSEDWPGNASITWDHAGSAVANTTVVPLDSSGSFGAHCAGTTHFVVDVIGYFR